MVRAALGKRLTIVNLITLIKSIFVGLIAFELWSLSQKIGEQIYQAIDVGGHQVAALLFCTVILVLVFVYLILRGFFPLFVRLLNSRRLDIFLAFVFGALISYSFGGFGAKLYDSFLNLFSSGQLIIVSLVPIIIGIALLLRSIQIWFHEKDKKQSSFFLNDSEKIHQEEDLLDFSDNAERFAELVLNRGSLDSIVFGIDAPWGIGKSTFVNFCIEYFEKNYSEQVIVYKFSPLRYEGGSHLLEKFIDGLIRVIQEKSFSPEIKPLISNYSRYIKETKTTFSLPWINFQLVSGGNSIDDVFSDLEATLSVLDKKVIVIVDDLDRIDFSSIKDILFAIKKSFTLPNISYILCYDTENINALGESKLDTDKINEFLEKFVNVKISLFLEAKVLKDFVVSNLHKALENNLQVDPKITEKARQVLEGVKEIYESSDFHEYLPFLGDIRKLKRLINTILLFEIENADFEESDFNKHDLIHLLLIYINYPKIFRKIFNTETDDKRGFFSLVMPYEDNYPKDPSNSSRGSAREEQYKNSTDFDGYFRTLTDNEKFLVKKVFGVKERLGDHIIDNVPSEKLHTYACFNGVWTTARNLEEYLNLIVKLSKPLKGNQYRFYLNRVKEIFGGKPIEEVLNKHEEFASTKNETSHEQLWRTIINSLEETTSIVGNKLIKYLLDHIHDYSFFTNKKIGVGFRDDISLFLTKLLDVVGWSDQQGKHRNNTEENIREIAEWVFGEERHKNEGVVDTLAHESRGIIGLYDVLAFRLFCSADRGGDIFNLSHALSKHGGKSAPTEGPTRDIAVEEMREISQKVFTIFKDQYINKEKNIFELIEKLTLTELCGKYYKYVEEKIKGEKINNVDQQIGELKSRIKSFVVYQLGNNFISNGVGCGYYDESGKQDKNGIRERMNDYLFDICFSAEKGNGNYQHFLDYLLINFAKFFASGDYEYKPHINEFTKILDSKRLLEYWRVKGDTIKKLGLEKIEKNIYQGNYIASYKKDLPHIFDSLDKALEEYDKEQSKDRNIATSTP